MKQKYDEDFLDWATADVAVAPQHEPVKNPMRRLEAVTVTWRGEVHHFAPEARLAFGQRTAVISPITLWPPTTDSKPPFPRRGWAADILVQNIGFLQGKGSTPQEALDALERELPTQPMVRGGSC
ncbi:MAG: hypothetical protein ABI488_23595 [Polyangiaceae bacterium]